MINDKELFITDKNGRNRRAKKHNCPICKADFLIRKSSKQETCSDKCRIEKRKNKVDLECYGCKEKIQRVPSKIKNAKHGFFFCSRECKENAQSLSGGLKQIQPSHYKTGVTNYRIKAFRHKESVCERCGCDKVHILQVHHKDKNRENNDIENLEILCPNCHSEEHYKGG